MVKWWNTETLVLIARFGIRTTELIYAGYLRL